MGDKPTGSVLVVTETGGVRKTVPSYHPTNRDLSKNSTKREKGFSFLNQTITRRHDSKLEQPQDPCTETLLLEKRKRLVNQGRDVQDHLTDL